MYSAYSHLTHSVACTLYMYSDGIKAYLHLYSATSRSYIGALCHRQTGPTAYMPYAKQAPTDFDLRPNSHTQPWYAV